MNEARITNCVLIHRQGDPIIFDFRSEQDWTIQLDGYVLIPREQYGQPLRDALGWAPPLAPHDNLRPGGIFRFGVDLWHEGPRITGHDDAPPALDGFAEWDDV